MKLHLLSGGRLRMRRHLYYPDAEREETFEMPVVCALLKHKQGNVLFDTGCHPSAADNGEGRWGRLATRMVPIFKAEEAVVGQLPRAGVTAEDIDVVICSHLHPDHCGCTGFFTKATVICHAEELARGRGPEAAANSYFREDWDHPLPITEIDAQYDVFGDGRLTLLPLPGHTPGMTVAHAVLDQDGAFVIASDAVPVRAVLDQRYAPKNSWDADLTLRGLDEISRLQRDGATVIFGHDDAQWVEVRKGEAFYS
jgi:N-acyl homoserine lactone hydrolase